jgi:hypothetical protein
MTEERWHPFRKRPTPKPVTPGERIWTVVRDHIECELKFKGEDYGWDARIIRAGEFFASYRFVLRAAAERWANEQKQQIEKGWTD